MDTRGAENSVSARGGSERSDNSNQLQLSAVSVTRRSVFQKSFKEPREPQPASYAPEPEEPAPDEERNAKVQLFDGQQLLNLKGQLKDQAFEEVA